MDSKQGNATAVATVLTWLVGNPPPQKYPRDKEAKAVAKILLDGFCRSSGRWRFSSPFDPREPWSSENLNDLPKVIQLIRKGSSSALPAPQCLIRPIPCLTCPHHVQHRTARPLTYWCAGTYGNSTFTVLKRKNDFLITICYILKYKVKDKKNWNCVLKSTWNYTQFKEKKKIMTHLKTRAAFRGLSF